MHYRVRHRRGERDKGAEGRGNRQTRRRRRRNRKERGGKMSDTGGKGQGEEKHPDVRGTREDAPAGEGAQ